MYLGICAHFLCVHKGNYLDFKGSERCYWAEEWRTLALSSFSALRSPPPQNSDRPAICSSLFLNQLRPPPSCSTPHFPVALSSLFYIWWCSPDLSVPPSQVRDMISPRFRGLEGWVGRQDSSCGRMWVNASGRPSSSYLLQGAVVNPVLVNMALPGLKWS